MPPTRGHDLKHFQAPAIGRGFGMPPTRGHDLKHLLAWVPDIPEMMPPTRGHDLKPPSKFQYSLIAGCPPHGGTT